MDIDSHLAASLGFHTTKYMAIERERRWLCRALPAGVELQSNRITDLYVTGARLRLRESTPLPGGPAVFRLTRKADVDAATRLITSIYLPGEEFRLLASSLPGKRLHKLRHRWPQRESGVVIAIDEFQGELSGLIMVEAEFESDDRMANFSAPDFAGPEITDDPRFTGATLASQGLPQNLSELLAAKVS